MGGGGDGYRDLRAKYLVPHCCNPDSLKFDMQHDHIVKKLNFDLFHPKLHRNDPQTSPIL